MPIGAPAPAFQLPATPDQRVSLDELRGHPVILAFYPADWSPVCGDQLALYNQLLPEFHRSGAQLVGISVDGVWCHTAFAEQATCTSPCWPTSSQRRGGPQLRRVPRTGRHLRARPVRHRCAEGIMLELRLAPGHQPGADGILEALGATSPPPQEQPDTPERSVDSPPGPRTTARARPMPPITLVEYGDYQCPYCGEALPHAQSGAAGHWATGCALCSATSPFRKPIPERAAGCAFCRSGRCRRGGEFWEAHDLLYQRQDA